MRNDNPIPVSFWKIPMGQRSLTGYSPWGRESSQTQPSMHMCLDVHGLIGHLMPQVTDDFHKTEVGVLVLHS